MKVRLSRIAQIDLLEIGDWIGTDNPQRALSFIDELESRCKALATSAKRYPAVLTMGKHEIRKRTYRRYIILYRVTSEQIEIDRIVHASRDWMALVEELLA